MCSRWYAGNSSQSTMRMEGSSSRWASQSVVARSSGWAKLVMVAPNILCRLVDVFLAAQDTVTSFRKPLPLHPILIVAPYTGLRAASPRSRQAMRILVVEDEERIAEFVRNGLSEHGYAVDVARDGGEALDWADIADFDVIVLDVMLPVRDGVDVCKTLRARGLRTPILMLTARDAVEDRVLGLDSGADDYLVKPFAFAELVARIRALARRGRGVDAPRLACGDLEMDLVTRRVTRAAKVVELTVREFELLEYLLRHHDQVVSRETLARDVWKETARTTPLDNVIDVHIARLRRKVDLDHAVKLIHTVRGVGFMLREGEP